MSTKSYFREPYFRKLYFPTDLHFGGCHLVPCQRLGMKTWFRGLPGPPPGTARGRGPGLHDQQASDVSSPAPWPPSECYGLGIMIRWQGLPAGLRSLMTPCERRGRPLGSSPPSLQAAGCPLRPQLAGSSPPIMSFLRLAPSGLTCRCTLDLTARWSFWNVPEGSTQL